MTLDQATGRYTTELGAAEGRHRTLADKARQAHDAAVRRANAAHAAAIKTADAQLVQALAGHDVVHAQQRAAAVQRFDEAAKLAVAAQDSARLVADSPSRIELLIGDRAEAIATATDEGSRWCIVGPDGKQFVGSATQARATLWLIAGQVPAPASR